MSRILITGGGSGIGKATALILAKNPKNQVFFTYNKSAESAHQIEAEFKNTKAIKCDFRDSSELEHLISETASMDCDILINNAITGLIEKHFHKIDPRVFAENFENNILPTIRLTQAMISHFRKKKSGRIITVLTSYLFNRPPTGMSEYVAGKAYLESLSKSWASENSSFNIIANCISPSLVQTRLTSHVDERIIEQLASSHPLKRLLTLEEIAHSIEFLVHASPHINGINLLLNGGADVI